MNAQLFILPRAFCPGMHVGYTHGLKKACIILTDQNTLRQFKPCLQHPTM